MDFPTIYQWAHHLCSKLCRGTLPRGNLEPPSSLICMRVCTSADWLEVKQGLIKSVQLRLPGRVWHVVHHQGRCRFTSVLNDQCSVCPKVWAGDSRACPTAQIRTPGHCGAFQTFHTLHHKPTNRTCNCFHLLPLMHIVTFSPTFAADKHSGVHDGGERLRLGVWPADYKNPFWFI